jgi:hypothetical protein
MEPDFSGFDDQRPPPLDLSSLTATPIPEIPHTVPDHYASTPSGKPPPEPPLTIRERLMGAKKPAAVKARNVKPGRPKRSVPNVPGQFIEPLTDFYNGVALVAMPFDAELSMTLIGPCKPPTEENPKPLTVAENCAKAWDEAAQRSESVRRMLDGFLTVSVWGTLIAAHAPLLMIVAKNHTPIGKKFDPAAAMEAMLRKQAEEQPE